jgi:hypothetical protein
VFSGMVDLYDAVAERFFRTQSRCHFAMLAAISLACVSLSFQ